MYRLQALFILLFTFSLLSPIILADTTTVASTTSTITSATTARVPCVAGPGFLCMGSVLNSNGYFIDLGSACANSATAPPPPPGH